MNPHARTVWTSLIALSSLVGLTASAQNTSLKPGDLVGRWQSVALENLGQLYGTRDFALTESTWSLEFVAYGDAAGQTKLFTLSAEGGYKLGQVSSVAAGVQETDFAFSKRLLTANGEAGVGLFKSMGCELRAGQITDVSAKGCGFIPSVGAAPVEFDLLKLEGKNLYFGDRSGDLSKARPAKLNALPVQRR